MSINIQAAIYARVSSEQQAAAKAVKKLGIEEES